MEVRDYIVALERLIPVLRNVDAVENEIGRKNNEINVLDRQIKNIGSSNIFILIGVFAVVSIVSFFFILLVFMSLLSASSLDPNVALMITLLFALCISPCIATIVIIFLRKWLKSGEDKKRNSLMSKRNAVISEIDSLRRRQKELFAYVQRDINILPPAYRYLLAAEYIYNCFVNCRANNLSQAINLYEEQLHRWRIENANETMLKLQRQQNAYAKATELNTFVTAVNTFRR